MDKKTNHIGYHPLNPQETKTNLNKLPKFPSQHLSTKKNPHNKTKLTYTQTKNIPHPLIEDISKADLPLKIRNSGRYLFKGPNFCRGGVYGTPSVNTRNINI